jgi:hypothetical protein
LAAPVVIDEEIESDSPKPSPYHFVGKVVRGAMCSKEHFLGEVGCLMVVPGQRHSIGPHARFVPADDGIPPAEIS